MLETMYHANGIGLAATQIEENKRLIVMDCGKNYDGKAKDEKHFPNPIKMINPELYYLGYNKIYWDGKDEYGNFPANGVYLYKMTASNNNQKVNHIGRLAIFR